MAPKRASPRQPGCTKLRKTECDGSDPYSHCSWIVRTGCKRKDATTSVPSPRSARESQMKRVRKAKEELVHDPRSKKPGKTPTHRASSPRPKKQLAPEPKHRTPSPKPVDHASSSFGGDPFFDAIFEDTESDTKPEPDTKPVRGFTRNLAGNVLYDWHDRTEELEKRTQLAHRLGLPLSHLYNTHVNNDNNSTDETLIAIPTCHFKFISANGYYSIRLCPTTGFDTKAFLKALLQEIPAIMESNLGYYLRRDFFIVNLDFLRGQMHRVSIYINVQRHEINIEATTGGGVTHRFLYRITPDGNVEDLKDNTGDDAIVKAISKYHRPLRFRLYFGNALRNHDNDIRVKGPINCTVTMLTTIDKQLVPPSRVRLRKKTRPLLSTSEWK